MKKLTLVFAVFIMFLLLFFTIWVSYGLTLLNVEPIWINIITVAMLIFSGIIGYMVVKVTKEMFDE